MSLSFCYVIRQHALVAASRQQSVRLNRAHHVQTTLVAAGSLWSTCTLMEKLKVVYVLDRKGKYYMIHTKLNYCVSGLTTKSGIYIPYDS